MDYGDEGMSADELITLSPGGRGQGEGDTKSKNLKLTPSPHRGNEGGISSKEKKLERRRQTLNLNAKRLRHDQTDAERKLWMLLRARRLSHLKFRRQQPIGRYIVDFICPEKRLVIELDGGQHASQVQADQRRTNFLTKAGYQVLRFWDHEVLADTEAVLEKIAIEVNHPSPPPSPSRGEGVTRGGR